MVRSVVRYQRNPGHPGNITWSSIRRLKIWLGTGLVDLST